MMQMNAGGHPLSIAAIKWTILQQGVREPTGVAIPARGTRAIPAGDDERERRTTEVLEHPKKKKFIYAYNFFHSRRYYPESGALESPSKTPSFRPLTWVYLVFLMWVSRTVTTKIQSRTQWRQTYGSTESW